MSKIEHYSIYGCSEVVKWLAKNNDKKIIAITTTDTRFEIFFDALPSKWITVDDPEKLLALQGTVTFLVPVLNSGIKTIFWDIITGYINDSGDLCSQINDEDSGWTYKDAAYYQLLDNLPPLPTETAFNPK